MNSDELMRHDELKRRLKGSNPYPPAADLVDDPNGDELRDTVQARVHAGTSPNTAAPRGGLLLAAAAAIVVLVLGAGVLLFTNGDDGPVAPVTSPTTEPPVTIESTIPTTSVTTPPTTPVAPEVPACRRAQPTEAFGESLAFFATCGGDATGAPYPVYRDLGVEPSTQADAMRLRIEALVAGTTLGEQNQGLSSGFDAVPTDERSRIEVSVQIDNDGVAKVDFLLDGERWNPGQLASASAQLFSFLDPLQATVFFDPDVSGLDRSTLCWGESSCTGVGTRAEWEGIQFVNNGVLFRAGCGLEGFHFSGDCAVDLDESTFAATVVNVAADDTLNVRAGPGTEYFVVAELGPFDEVAAFDRFTALASDGGSWRLVRLGDAGPTVGWVNTAFLAPTDSLGDRTAEQQLIDSLVAFARVPNDATFKDLPLGDVVELGLGQDLHEVRTADGLRLPQGWTIDIDLFAGYGGPFSAFDVLSRIGNYEVTIGDHAHCASPARPAPVGLDELTRISVQPVLGEQSSCLEWFTVDLFVTPSGLVEAITLDLWEP